MEHHHQDAGAEGKVSAREFALTVFSSRMVCMHPSQPRNTTHLGHCPLLVVAPSSFQHIQQYALNRLCIWTVVQDPMAPPQDGQAGAPAFDPIAYFIGVQYWLAALLQPAGQGDLAHFAPPGVHPQGAVGQPLGHIAFIPVPIQVSCVPVPLHTEITPAIIYCKMHAAGAPYASFVHATVYASSYPSFHNHKHWGWHVLTL